MALYLSIPIPLIKINIGRVSLCLLWIMMDIIHRNSATTEAIFGVYSWFQFISIQLLGPQAPVMSVWVRNNCSHNLPLAGASVFSVPIVILISLQLEFTTNHNWFWWNLHQIFNVGSTLIVDCFVWNNHINEPQRLLINTKTDYLYQTQNRQVLSNVNPQYH